MKLKIYRSIKSGLKKTKITHKKKKNGSHNYKDLCLLSKNLRIWSNKEKRSIFNFDVGEGERGSSIYLSIYTRLYRTKLYRDIVAPRFVLYWRQGN